MRVVGGLGYVIVLGVLFGNSSCGSTSSSPQQAGGAAGNQNPAAAGTAGASGGGGGEAGGGQGGAIDPRPEGGGAGATEDDPFATCEGAGTQRSHVGCEFWPTLVTNPVWSDFSPGLLLSNAGESEAIVDIEGPNDFHETVALPPRQTRSVELAWVPELKGPEWSSTLDGARAGLSTVASGAAYKVTSSRPISAWQLSPLQVELASACDLIHEGVCGPFSGEASLLLPTTSLTGNYRAMSLSTQTWDERWDSSPGALAVTAVKDKTTVRVQLPPHCSADVNGTGPCTVAGNGVPSKNAGEVYTFDMNAGDVTLLAGFGATKFPFLNADLSGTVINADQPVQVVAFVGAVGLPDVAVTGTSHVEETVPPAESFGKKYVVTPPSGSVGSVGHSVRLYGNVNGTVLSYPDGKPAGAPDVINAGEVAQIPPLPAYQEGTGETCKVQPGHCLVTEPFTVEGSQPFGVATFLPGQALLDPAHGGLGQGNPAASWVQTPDQFRQSYVLALPDLTTRVADVLAPKGATLFLDGSPLALTPALEIAGWQLFRLELDDADFHELSTDTAQGMSVQLQGYGVSQGYYYPAGGNFKLLSEPPQIIP